MRCAGFVEPRNPHTVSAPLWLLALVLTALVFVGPTADATHSRDNDANATITANGIAGTISSESTDGGSTFTYNGDSFSAWDKAWGGAVTIVRSSSSGAETLTLTGTYT